MGKHGRGHTCPSRQLNRWNARQQAVFRQFVSDAEEEEKDEPVIATHKDNATFDGEVPNSCANIRVKFCIGKYHGDKKREGFLIMQAPSLC